MNEPIQKLLTFLDEEIDRGGSPERWEQAKALRAILSAATDNLMSEAWKLTNGDRRDAYGDPREVFTAYGWAWSAIIAAKLKPGEFINAEDATLMMAALKICREANKVKRDNVVDAHGYLSLHSRVAGLLEEAPPAKCGCDPTGNWKCADGNCPARFRKHQA